MKLKRTLFIFLLIITIFSIALKLFTIEIRYADGPTTCLFFSPNLISTEVIYFFSGFVYTNCPYPYDEIDKGAKLIMQDENGFIMEPLYDFLVSYGWFIFSTLLIILIVFNAIKRKKSKGI